MPLRSVLSRSIAVTGAVTGLLAVSSAVHASGLAAVIVGPLTSAPVPSLNGYLLIILGLLLAVIAFRTLRTNRGAHKLLSILVLGGGLIVSGVGVDRTLATVPVSASGAVCDEGGPISFSPYSYSALENNCTNPIEIKGFTSQGCELDTANAGCQQGQVLTTGSECQPLPQCNQG